MTNSTALVTTNQNAAEDNFFDAFSDIGQVDPFELKKDHLGAQMAALMAFSGKSRSELTEILGWKKSRVSNVMSGKCNLTIKTIWEFASSLGFDFEVVFHTPCNSPQIQPWQIAQREVALTFPLPTIEVQTAFQVARDLMNGSYKALYFSVPIQKKGNDVPIGLAHQSQINTISSPIQIQIAINS
ncbi:MAG: helix-turn-helix transcriptional regulator [Nitrosomonadales bacterium]|nr:helix-turn-helix transcriptional regulator [Nitrosomonadales bacterium]